jgi:hypothetical protein
MKVQSLLEFLHAKCIGVGGGMFFSQRPSFLKNFIRYQPLGLEEDLHESRPELPVDLWGN